jgi:uncharacterized spore protein YtfJ
MIEQETARLHAEKIFSAAQAGVVYGQPVTAQGYTVITASEVLAGGGYGFGSGTAPDAQGASTAGGGGGGGGFSSARPVAAIVIGAEGVKVEPIVDVTKLAVAGITAWGVMLGTVMRMRSARRG